MRKIVVNISKCLCVRYIKDCIKGEIELFLYDESYPSGLAALKHNIGVKFRELDLNVPEIKIFENFEKSTLLIEIK